MTTRQWVNSRQPQTLYLAQILMYIQGGMDLLFSLLYGEAPLASRSGCGYWPSLTGC